MSEHIYRWVANQSKVTIFRKIPHDENWSISCTAWQCCAYKILSVSANMPLKHFQTEAESSGLLIYPVFNLWSLKKESGRRLEVQADLQWWWSGYFPHRSFITTIKQVLLSVLYITYNCFIDIVFSCIKICCQSFQLEKSVNLEKHLFSFPYCTKDGWLIWITLTVERFSTGII